MKVTLIAIATTVLATQIQALPMLWQNSSAGQTVHHVSEELPTIIVRSVSHSGIDHGHDVFEDVSNVEPVSEASKPKLRRNKVFQKFLDETVNRGHGIDMAGVFHSLAVEEPDQRRRKRIGAPDRPLSWISH